MYVVAEDVFMRYPILRTWGLSPDQVITDLIPYAEADLNGRLGAAFTVPITNGSSSFVIKDLAIELSYCKALFTKEPKQATERYDAVVKRITDIVEGKVVIPDAVSNETLQAEQNVLWSNTMNYNPTHSMLDAEDASVDPYMNRDEYMKRYGSEIP